MADSGRAPRWSGKLGTIPELIPDFDLVISTIALTANINNPIVAGNSQRFGLWFFISVANSVFILPRAMSALSTGIPLGAGMQDRYYNVRDHGILPTRDWHAWTAVPGQSMLILEIIYKPK